MADGSTFQRDELGDKFLSLHDDTSLLQKHCYLSPVNQPVMVTVCITLAHIC